MYTKSPMSFAVLIIFMFVAFGLTTLFRKWMDIPTLLAVAIGAAVNANLFNPITSPIYVGRFIFSMEIILYTLFMYTIVVRILDYGYNDAKRMTFTSVAAIIISAFIELVARLAAKVSMEIALKEFSYYLISSVGTVIGVWVMILITIHCRRKRISPYLIIPFAIIASSLIHSTVYYGGILLIEWKRGVYTLFMFLGALIGKGACILLAIPCYYINKNYWIPLNLRKEEEIEEQEECETD